MDIPAFPVVGNKKEHDYNSGEDFIVPYVQKGMTLRDYFAGQAVINWDWLRQDQRIGEVELQAVARRAYEVADAMLTERLKESTDER